MLFVYSTPAFDKKMQSSDFKVLQSYINALRKRIEKKQQYTGFTPFNDGYYVKKKLQYKYRLIARMVQIAAGEIDEDEHELLVFHDLMIRRDPAYNNPSDAHCFCRDPEGFAVKHKYITDDHEQRCHDYCKQRLNEKNVVKPQKTPSNYENEILYGTLRGAKNRDSISIYEMKEWVSSLNDKANLEILTTFLHRLYESVVDATLNATLEEKMGWAIQKVEYGSGHKRWYSYYYNPNEMIFALGKIEASEEDAKNFISKYESIFENFDKNKVLKHISRSYPESVLQNSEDHSLWENIETEKSNNMALSPEELDILSSVLNSESREYPLFINGRAGSGKSTILQFLFTSYYFHYLCSKNEHDASPIYFTYNDKLLTAARETVDKLLGNHEYLGSINDETYRNYIEDKKKRSRDKSFRNFSAFLLEVAKTKKTGLFLSQNKIDFQKFKTLWQKKFQHDQEVMRKTTPEICWHVIRTYIKGDSVEALMDVQEYEASPSHSISTEMFKLIYEKVWLPWYSTITLFTDKGDQEFEAKPKSEYWDDQDLVRYVLNEDEESESGSLLDKYFEENDRFCAIFCDESQDFTHIELEAILEMSLFLYRNVNQNYIHKIPFVFAGDPFQTLNPTGFSWEATKKGFVDKIARVLDRKAEKVDLNYKELKMNYRSESNIVKFSNTVQIIRAANLNPEKHLIEPQLPWNEEKGSCLFFDWKNTEFWKWLEKNGDVSFILPCESSNRGKFIDDDPILKEHLCRADHVPGKEGGYKYPVFSAQDIKGLEYDKVAVFGFGAFDKNPKDGYNSRFANLIKKGISETDSHLLEMEYFMNRLYVAVTRPKKQLLILDEPSNTFWDSLKVDQDGEQPVIAWLESIIPQNCKNAWNKNGKAIEKFALPIRGRSSLLSGETSGEEREKFAEQQLQLGIDNHDEVQLDLALQRFISIKGESSQKCAEIKGYIAYVKADYESAAKDFYEAGKTISANHCWFLAFKEKQNSVLPEMRRLAKEDPDCSDSLQYKLITHSKNNTLTDFFVTSLDECARLEKDYAKNLKNDIFSWDRDYESWQNCFNDILHNLSDEDLSEAQTKQICNAIDKQNLFGFDNSLLIDFYFKRKIYDKLNEFESQELNSDDRRKIGIAKAKSEGFPKNLHTLSEAKDYDTICEIYKHEYEIHKNKIVELMDAATIKIIFEASKQKKNIVDWSLLICLFSKYIDVDTWTAYYNTQKKTKTYRQDCIQLLSLFATMRNETFFAKDIEDKLRQYTKTDSKESFNLFYICCLGIANEHPVNINLGACLNAMRAVFQDVSTTVSKYNLTLADLLQFGRFYEYISSQCEDKDKPRFWQYAINFYEDVQKEPFVKEDQKVTISKRIIFAKEQISEAYERLSRNRHLKRTEMETHLMKSNIYQHEANADRKNNSISLAEKIESLTNSQKEPYWQTMNIASRAWQHNGFIIKQETIITDELIEESFDKIDSVPQNNEIQETQTLTTKENALPEVTKPQIHEVKEMQILEEKTDAPNSAIPMESAEDDTTDKSESESAAQPSEKNAEIDNNPVTVQKNEEKTTSEPNEIKTVETTVQEDVDDNQPLVYPDSIILEIAGYKIKGNTEDEDYSISIFAAASSKLLGSVNSYGPSPIRQKGLKAYEDGFSYGDLPKIEIKLINDCYVVTIGSISMRVKKALE